MARRYQWKRDPADPRDRIYKHPKGWLPPLVDLRPFCSPVDDQGRLGSCTGHAIAGGLEYLERRVLGKHTDRSRLFIYWNERAIEKTVSRDAGAIIRNGIKSVAKHGACDERLWPYDVRKFKERPCAAAFDDAAQRRLTAYERCRAVDDVRHALAMGFPVVFGMEVFPEFEGDLVARTGTVPMPGPGSESVGGHAVLAVGYDDSKRRIIVRNSWGPGWGRRGYFTLPYAYLFGELSEDFWVMKP